METETSERVCFAWSTVHANIGVPCNRIAMKFKVESSIESLPGSRWCVWLFYFCFSIPLFALLIFFSFGFVQCFNDREIVLGDIANQTDLSSFQFNQKPCNFLKIKKIKIIFISCAAVILSAATRCGFCIHFFSTWKSLVGVFFFCFHLSWKEYTQFCITI